MRIIGKCILAVLYFAIVSQPHSVEAQTVALMRPAELGTKPAVLPPVATLSKTAMSSVPMLALPLDVPTVPTTSAPPAIDTVDDCDKDKDTVDCRGVIDVSAYTGMAIDTFAADEVKKYLNPGASGDIQYRGIFGFDFAARVHGKPDLDNKTFERSLWLYGETLHGVRSADIDCTQHPDFPTCQAALAAPTTLPQQTVFMLRNASTLEGYFGLRWEFMQLQPGQTPINLYAKAQAGFMSVSSNPQLADAHHVAVGLIAPKGTFTDSYIEAGFGRTDLFLTNKRKRYKIDGYVQRKILNSAFSFFAQMLVDTDIGRGSDAVQSFIGFNVDLKCLFDSSCK